MIETVYGPIDAREVHLALAHEHCTFGLPGMASDPSGHYRRGDAFSACVRHFSRLEGHDVNFVLDCTPMERGRDPQLLREVSRATGIYLACSTGFFLDEGDVLAFLRAVSYTTDLGSWMCRLFVSELTDGIGDTGIRAGVIKVATSFGQVKPLEQEILRAAAAASHETDAPITTHCDRGTMAREQVRILLGAGADPAKVIVGHQTCNRDLGEIMWVMDQGVTVGFDQFGIESIPGIPSDEEKCENLLTLLERGYEDRIALSNDCACERMGLVNTSKQRSVDNVFVSAVPFLREHGISDVVIRKLLRDNLVRVLEV